MQQSIATKAYIPINIGQVLNYSCNGDWLADQSMLLGTYFIPSYTKVKSVTVQFSGVADDVGVLHIGGVLTITQADDPNAYYVAKPEYLTHFNVNKTFPISLNTENVKVSAGTINTSVHVCRFSGSVNLRFNYSN